MADDSDAKPLRVTHRLKRRLHILRGYDTPQLYVKGHSAESRFQ